MYSSSTSQSPSSSPLLELTSMLSSPVSNSSSSQLRVISVSKSPLAGAMSLEMQRNSQNQPPQNGSNGKPRTRYVLAKKLSENKVIQEEIEDNGGNIGTNQAANIATNFQHNFLRSKLKHFTEQQPSKSTGHKSSPFDLSKSSKGIMAQLAHKLAERARMKTARMDDAERAKRNNIFNNPHQTIKPNEKFIEFNGGPRFQDGRVVSYSVVGPPQLFAKFLSSSESGRTSIKDSNSATIISQRQQNIKRQVKNDNSGFGSGGVISSTNFILTPQTSQPNSRTQSMHSNNPNQSQNTGEDGLSDTRSNFIFTRGERKLSIKKGNGPNSNSSTGGIWFSKKKYKNADFTEKTKEELFDEMAMVKERILIQEANKMKILNNLSIENRNHATREERVMNKYDQTVEQWTRELALLSRSSKRKPEDTLMLKAEAYRQKKELIDGYESLQGDQSRLGARAWYSQLRRTEIRPDSQVKQSKLKEANQDLCVSKTNIRQIENRSSSSNSSRRDPQMFNLQEQTVNDIFSNFGSVSVNNPYKAIEVVRKIIGEKKKLNISSSTSYTARHLNSGVLDANQFFHSQISANQHALKDKFVLPPEENMNDLKIEGQSVFQKELEVLQQDGNPESKMYDKLDFIKEALHHVETKPGVKENLFNHNQKEAQIQSLNDERIIEKYYVPSELTKTGRYFFKDI